MKLVYSVCFFASPNVRGAFGDLFHANFNNCPTLFSTFPKVMATNSSTSLPQLSAIYIIKELNICLKSLPGALCISTYIGFSFLFQCPLCIFIIYLGFQRQRSGTPMSHSDFLSYHIVATELMGILGSLALICGTYNDLWSLVGLVIVFIYSLGQIIINILTCAEYYLAAVYPITYRTLRNAKGIRIRNISSICVWLFTFGWTSVMITHTRISTIFSTFILLCAIVMVSFFCLSVLCVLIGSGPEKGGGANARVDQTKLKAFYTMMAIMGVMLLTFWGNISMCAMVYIPDLGIMERCIGYCSTFWTCLPSGVFHPLLFLKRAGKLTCKKPHKETGQRRQ